HRSVLLLFLLSFPTRRSSDLMALFLVLQAFLITRLRQKQAGPFSLPAHRGIVSQHIEDNHVPGFLCKPLKVHVLMAVIVLRTGLDRKSTRLNSSHVSISYAVF